MTVVALFKRFGSYHIARAKAATGRVPCLWLQMSLVDNVYAWRREPMAELPVRTLLGAENGDANEASPTILRDALKRHLQDLPVQVMVVPGWSHPGALVAIQWASSRNVPVVVMSESNAFDHSRTVWGEWMKRRLLRFFAAGLVGGTHARDYLVALGMAKERIFLGYNAVDNNHFASSMPPPKLAARPPFFLASSRFIAKKNLFRLVDAYDAYRARVGSNAWRLVIVGDGELRGELKAHCERRALAAFVSFPGFVQYDELPAWYGVASCFIHASTTEQWGLVVNEAMAAGLPALVSKRCGCAPDLVREGVNGFTFDPYDVQGTADLMFRVAHGDVDREAMGRASREIIAEWGPERFADGLEKAVEAALAAPLPKPTLLDRALLWALIHR